MVSTWLDLDLGFVKTKLLSSYLSLLPDKEWFIQPTPSLPMTRDVAELGPARPQLLIKSFKGDQWIQKSFLQFTPIFEVWGIILIFYFLAKTLIKLSPKDWMIIFIPISFQTMLTSRFLAKTASSGRKTNLFYLNVFCFCPLLPKTIWLEAT